MKRILLGGIVIVLFLAACAPTVIGGLFQVAPAPQINSAPQVSPQSETLAVRFQKAIDQLFPKLQGDVKGKAKEMCDAAAELLKSERPKQWDLEVLPGDSADVVQKKTKMKVAISLLSGPMCKEWYSVMVIDDVFTVGGPRADAKQIVVPFSVQEPEMADLAKKGKWNKAKEACDAAAALVKGKNITRDQVAIDPALHAAIERLAGPVCSIWYTVKYTTVYVITEWWE